MLKKNLPIIKRGIRVIKQASDTIITSCLLPNYTKLIFVITRQKTGVVLKKFFSAIVDEDNEFEEENYNEEWLNDNNWYIIDT